MASRRLGPARGPGLPGLRRQRPLTLVDPAEREAGSSLHRPLGDPSLHRHLVLRRPDRALERQPRLGARLHAPQVVPDQPHARGAALPHHERDEHDHGKPRVPPRPAQLRVRRRTRDHVSRERSARRAAQGGARLPGWILSVGGQPDGEHHSPVPGGGGHVSEPGRAGLGLIRAGASGAWPRGCTERRISLARRGWIPAGGAEE